ncbi:MAG: hypothetical protein COB04_01485 [Gammaproteobacteria bacterium]|nr:MAG: hypothetical protein COB04_01485 [Gammaproteobacteria bacterium]
MTKSKLFIVVCAVLFFFVTPVMSEDVKSFEPDREQALNSVAEFTLPKLSSEQINHIILTAMYGAVILFLITVFFSYLAISKTSESESPLFLSTALPNAIEGITIVYVVVSVLVLAISGVTSAEGSLSILSAIAGYVLGKSQGAKKLSS